MRILFLLVLFLGIAGESYAEQVSPQAEAILSDYRKRWCESAAEVAGYKVEPGSVPIFQIATSSYKKIVLSDTSIVAELIYTGDMKCNGYRIYSSIGGNATSHFIINEDEYTIFGGEPFFIRLDAQRRPREAKYLPALLIAWWGSDYTCMGRLSDNNASIESECLNIVYYDERLRTFVSQQRSP